jgi:aspartate racemase
MEEEFYRGRLMSRHGLQVVIPNPEDREAVHRIIFEELCVGTIRPESRARMAGIMSRLVESGAEGVILGCTELDLLVENGDCCVPLFDTTRLHALAAVEHALKAPFCNPLP